MAFTTTALDSLGRVILNSVGKLTIGCDFLVAPVRACSDDSLVVNADSEQLYGVCVALDTDRHYWWSETVKACVYIDCTESVSGAGGELIDLSAFSVTSCSDPACDQDGDGNPDDPDPTPEPVPDIGTDIDCCGNPTDEYYEIELAGLTDDGCRNVGFGTKLHNASKFNGIWRLPLAGGTTCTSLFLNYSVDYTDYVETTCINPSASGTAVVTMQVAFDGAFWDVTLTVAGATHDVVRATNFGDCDGGTAANSLPSVGGTVTVRKRAALP